MDNLFSDLFKYREREARAPLEDFTTEILKHLLKIDQCGDRKILEFILKKIKREDYLNKKKEDLRIDSQESIEKGRLDILITDDKAKPVIIENKVNASFSPGQIKKYRERYRDCTLVILVKNYYEFQNSADNPDFTLYWCELADFLEYQYNGENWLAGKFLQFLKEEKMALNKIGWALLDGLREKENLINMINLILTEFAADRKLIRTKKKSTGEGWDVFNYRIPESTVETDILFYNSDTTLYFRAKDKNNKYKLEYFYHKSYKVVDRFNFAKEHFFPLEAGQQKQKLIEFINNAITKSKKL